MKSLRYLAWATDLVAFGTIMLGSWTRINGAGLTCPDWPLCQGHVMPPMANGTVFEFTHRVLAMSIAPLVVCLLVAAWRRRDRSPFITPAMIAIGLFFFVQVLLGAATVRLNNSPMSVVLHWGTAMAFIAAVSALGIFAETSQGAAEKSDTRTAVAIAGVLAGTSIITFLTMCVGAYVSSSGAGLACLSFPGCAGNVVVYTQGQAVQMLHRIAAGATLVCAAGSLAFAFARPASARVRVAALAGVALVCVQVLLGLLNVALRLPTDLREAHAINAALVFLSFVVATTFAILDARVLPTAETEAIRA
ncbi:MAG TPA: COX15/CtaA family protein [Candidatus Baltobacteraceae bacterium]|nr:COX15/CtaA family protein [Candidatus Baltobacteraceae bacterium]